MSSSSIVKSLHGRQYREYRGSAADLYTTHCCLPRDYWGHLHSPTFPLSDGWWPPSKNLVWSLHPAGRSDFRSKSGVERDVLRSSAHSYIVLTLPPSSGRNSERLQGGLYSNPPPLLRCFVFKDFFWFGYYASPICPVEQWCLKSINSVFVRPLAPYI